MYFPYLRGRQSEMLAIRKLLKEDRLNIKVTPVIEPVKPTATLRKTLEYFIERERELILVSNPQVGSFKNELNKTDETKMEFSELINNPLIKTLSIIKEADDLNERYDGYILKSEDSLQLYKNSRVVDSSKMLFVPYKPEFRRRLSEEGKTILHVDHFQAKERNADYLDVFSYVFSSDHKHFVSEGYYGFSDYSIVGSKFMEGGFAPRAIAIHMISLNNDNELHINHFTSETNDGISNPAGKFDQALTKLVSFFEGDSINETFALKELRKHNHNGTYPGLGVVKQLSIMHHLELIGKYLEGNNR